MMINVVAALICKDNKILIARRATGDPNVLGKWEFPGGKVEANESEEAAIEREIKEEFELTVKAKRFLINNICEYPEKKIDLRLYECEYLSGEFCLHDHFEYKWVEITKLIDFDLAPADVLLARYVMEEYK
ncbi:(deoxy)nucleoside triphosphate pyrophosphohydrolase [bacterium]|nr:(deoxy)nucleoside triphosphate pyrophosphohydrolase [bacterium]